MDVSASETVDYWLALEQVSHERRILFAHFVYFIQEADGGPVKIGSARDPRGRAAELQCGNPRPLCVRQVILARGDTEQILHDFWTDPKWMKDARVRGEWFGRGHEVAILAMGARISQRQMLAHKDGASLDDVRGKVFTRAMFAKAESEAA